MFQVFLSKFSCKWPEPFKSRLGERMTTITYISPNDVLRVIVRTEFYTKASIERLQTRTLKLCGPFSKETNQCESGQSADVRRPFPCSLTKEIRPARFTRPRGIRVTV